MFQHQVDHSSEFNWNSNITLMKFVNLIVLFIKNPFDKNLKRFFIKIEIVKFLVLTHILFNQKLNNLLHSLILSFIRVNRILLKCLIALIHKTHSIWTSNVTVHIHKSENLDINRQNSSVQKTWELTISLDILRICNDFHELV